MKYFVVVGMLILGAIVIIALIGLILSLLKSGMNP